MNGARSGLMIAGLAAAWLLLTMPGAQAASAGVDIAASAPQVRAELPVYELSNHLAAGRHADQLPGSPFASVMPRGGDGQAQAPMRREFDWIPLLVVGGLLATGVGAYLLYSARRPA